ncbi:MAG: Asp-tRNA(Asn)/Glu-tRNA(Gln) amidotransferase subunit GatC [Mariprofundales bacterium]
MMHIDVHKTAMLARIRLTDTEADTLGPQLERLMEYIALLQTYNTDGVMPMAHPHDAAMPLRADVVTNSNRRDTLQAVAPNVEAGLFVVPKVIE